MFNLCLSNGGSVYCRLEGTTMQTGPDEKRPSYFRSGQRPLPSLSSQSLDLIETTLQEEQGEATLVASPRRSCCTQVLRPDDEHDTEPRPHDRHGRVEEKRWAVESALLRGGTACQRQIAPAPARSPRASAGGGDERARVPAERIPEWWSRWERGPRPPAEVDPAATRGWARGVAGERGGRRRQPRLTRRRSRGMGRGGRGMERA